MSNMTAMKKICSIVLVLCLIAACGCGASVETPAGVQESAASSEDSSLAVEATVEDNGSTDVAANAETTVEDEEPTDVEVNALHNLTIDQRETGEGEISLFPSGKLDVNSQEAFREAIDAICMP